MKLSYAAAAMSLGLAAAAPVNENRQTTPTTTAISTGLFTIETIAASSSSSAAIPPYATVTGIAPVPTGGFPIPSGVFPVPSGVFPIPSGTASTYMPIGTGSTGSMATCPVNGALVCNGPNQFGLCNWGHVIWQPVAEGTQCVDGVIGFAPGFGGT